MKVKFTSKALACAYKQAEKEAGTRYAVSMLHNQHGCYGYKITRELSTSIYLAKDFL